MIEIYIAEIAPLKDAERYDRLLASVHPARRARIDRLHLSADRRRALAAQLLLENALRLHGITDPVFSCGEHGKPMLDGNADVHFNLSHAGEYAVCAISDAEIGVDVERIDPSIHSLAIADRFFTPAEAGWIRAGATEEEISTRFFRLWTLKESYLKATGRGFSLSPRAFSFSMEGRAPTLADVPSDLPSLVSFAELSEIAGYRLALCALDGRDCTAVRMTAIDLKTLC